MYGMESRTFVLVSSLSLPGLSRTTIFVSSANFTSMTFALEKARVEMECEWMSLGNDDMLGEWEMR